MDESYDSNANLKQTYTSSDGGCAVTITTLDPPGGRVAGTFSGYAGEHMNDGVFDIPLTAGP
jgi:hypothetical protein